MAILFHTSAGDPVAWVDELQRQLPDDEIRVWPDVGDRDDIEFVVMWDLPLDELNRLPNLRAILLNGSGTNHLRPIEELPDVPIVRLVDADVARDMAYYALSWIVYAHRHFHVYAAQQADGRWQRYDHHRTDDTVVAVLGLGNIGRRIATVTSDAGYAVRGWSRSPKQIDGVEIFSGPDQLDDCLRDARIVVNVLPLTGETYKLIDARRLDLLHPGASMVNIGRAGTVDDDAMCAALDSGHLDLAVLDVFRTEPLPPDAPMWSQRGVIVTPHCSGWANPRSSVTYMTANIARIRAGEQPFPIFNPTQGY